MPSGESWESTGREDDGAACSSVRDVRRGGNGGCSQKADQRTYIDGSSELSFTAGHRNGSQKLTNDPSRRNVSREIV